MQSLNMRMKKLSEYWYMGPMSARSAITKYRMDPRTAAARYVSRVLLIWFSVVSASSSRPESSARDLGVVHVSINTSSSRMSPSDSFSMVRILSCSSCNCFLSLLMDTTSLSCCLFQVGALHAHDVAELVLQPFDRRREVDHRHLDAHFRQVVPVRHLGGEVELEVGVVIDVRVPQTNRGIRPFCTSNTPS